MKLRWRGFIPALLGHSKLTVDLINGDTEPPELRPTHIFSGISMLPTIPDGAACGFESVDYKDVQMGGIYAFVVKRGQIAVHRAVRKKRLGWVMQGDNLARPDAELMTKYSLLGRLVWFAGPDGKRQYT